MIYNGRTKRRLNLISFLLSDRSSTHLLIIGNYRDDEPQAANHLLPMIDGLRQQGGLVREIYLSQLAVVQVQSLIADTLHCPQDQAASLAQVVMEKGGGSPFFVKQFLQTLHATGVLVIEENLGNGDGIWMLFDKWKSVRAKSILC